MVGRQRVLLFLVSVGLLAPGIGGAAARMGKPGQFQILRGVKGRKVLDAYQFGQNGDEFGSAFSFQAVAGTVAGGFLIGAPGADDAAGGLLIVDPRARSIVQRITAGAIDSDLGRFGQSLMNVGHIGNALSVHWVVGAPGDPNDPGAPTHVIVLARTGGAYAARDIIEGEPGSMFGWRLAGLDDAEQDSIIAGFAVGAPRARRGRKADVGAVQAYDSTTAQRLWERRASRKGELFGYWIQPTVDADGDGTSDLVVGAPGNRKRKPAGRVYLISGSTGAVLRRWEAPAGAIWFGFRALYLDLDRDGAQELISSAPATDVGAMAEAGSVFVLSDSGQLRQRFDGDGAGEWFGVHLGLADAQGDGTLELQIGRLERNAKRRKDLRGGVEALDISTGKVVSKLRGRKRGDYFGLYGLFATIDVDQDGDSDRIVGVPRAPIPFVPQ